MAEYLDTIQRWAGRKLELIEAYQAAVQAHKAADVHLSALLTAKYGKRAGDMRYRKPETVEIAEAMRAKLNASEAQQTAWLAYQKGGGDGTHTD